MWRARGGVDTSRRVDERVVRMTLSSGSSTRRAHARATTSTVAKGMRWKRAHVGGMHREHREN